MSTDDLENAKCTNYGGDLRFRDKLRTLTRGIGELLYIDKYIFNVSKTRRENQAMAWIDKKKGYNINPQR